MPVYSPRTLPRKQTIPTVKDRSRISEALIADALSAKNVDSPFEAFGSIAQAYSGHRLQGRQAEEEKTRRSAIADALAGIDFADEGAASDMIRLGAEADMDSLVNAGVGMATRKPSYPEKYRNYQLAQQDEGYADFLSRGEQGKPPSGYRWNEEGNLDAVPGGPATDMSAEVAGRVSMLEAALPGIDEAYERVKNASGSDFVMAQANAGEIGRAQRQVRTAIEAALRAMTGAAAPESEVKRYEDMFMPATTDRDETIDQKRQLLTSFIDNVRQTVYRGRGDPPPVRSSNDVFGEADAIVGVGQ